MTEATRPVSPSVRSLEPRVVRPAFEQAVTKLGDDGIALLGTCPLAAHAGPAAESKVGRLTFKTSTKARLYVLYLLTQLGAFRLAPFQLIINTVSNKLQLYLQLVETP